MAAALAVQGGGEVRLTPLPGEPRNQAPGRPVPELKAQQGRRQHMQLKVKQLPANKKQVALGKPQAQGALPLVMSPGLALPRLGSYQVPITQKPIALLLMFY